MWLNYLIIDCITIVKPWIVKQAKKKSQSDEVKLRTSGLRESHAIMFTYCSSTCTPFPIPNLK